MTTTQQEWQHIAVYESACADTAKTILNLFESELPENVQRWLRIEHEVRTEKRIEAEKEL